MLIREFRGKARQDFRGGATSRWVEGFLFKQSYDCGEIVCIGNEPLSANDYSDILGDWCEVIPETVGQFIGRYDINGKKVFEGDILKYTVDDCEHICRVVFDDKKSAFVGYSITKNSFKYNIGYVSLDKLKNIEIIGNAFNNPELLITEEV